MIAVSVGFIVFHNIIATPLFQYFPYIIFLAGVALVDDKYSISAISRLILQLLVAGVFVYKGLLVESTQFLSYEVVFHPLVAIVGSTLFIVWLINLYNFMDGMDGFSGGMAIFGFATFALLAYLKGEEGFMIANLIMVASVAGFLVFNFPPSKIFMGDIGSTVIGMIVALFSIKANNDGIIPLYVSVIIFAPFILDSTLTLIRRALRGEKIWEAHRSHYYQRLVLLGLGHRKTLLLEYLWMLICSIIAVALINTQDFDEQIKLLLLFIVLSSVFLAVVDIKTRNIEK